MGGEGDLSQPLTAVVDGGEGGGDATVSVNVRCSNGSKFTVRTSLDSTVEAFKELVAQNSEVPANQQRLIYKSRILKDDQSLLSYGEELLPSFCDDEPDYEFNPQLRTMLDSNPQLREMMQNPDFLRQFSSPEMMQGTWANWSCCRRDRQQQRMAGFIDEYVWWSWCWWPGWHKPIQCSSRGTLCDSVATAARNGFYDRAENIRALLATNGNVNAAVERLLGSIGQ